MGIRFAYIKVDIMSISETLFLTLRGVGKYQIRPFSQKLWSQIKDLVLWSGSDKFGYAREVRFGDAIWKPIGEKEGATFTNLSISFEYELKILLLALYTNGVGEGMPPLKWGTLIGGMRILKAIALQFSNKRMVSFSDLPSFGSLKLKTLLIQLTTDLALNKKPRVLIVLHTSFQWLKHYGLLTDREVNSYIDLAKETIAQHKNSGNKRHSIIPTNILKKLISSILIEIDRIRPSVDTWKKFQRREIKRIESRMFLVNNGKYKSIGDKSLPKNYMTILKDVNALKGITNTLVLAFTGMRDSEALALKNDCLITRKIQGVKSFFVTTALSKTTDGQQELEWICSETAASAIELLAEVNSLAIQKAKVILDTIGDELSMEYKNELQQGVIENGMLSPIYNFGVCGFFRMSKRPNYSTFDITGYFQVSVDTNDIAQLERLGCNYQSVSPSSINRGKPYAPGDIFNFTPHQFRHTFAWFIIANRLGELDDIRYQFKHLWESMTLIYSKRGYESIGELLNLADQYSEDMTKLTVTELIKYSEEGSIAGKGGNKFHQNVRKMLGDQHTSGTQAHFKDVSQLVEYVSKNSDNLRGVGHGYCTKSNDCKIKNIADPSHCVYCDGYISTPRHLPYWQAIKNSCESKLDKIANAPQSSRTKLQAFESALQNNLNAANLVIYQLECQRVKINE